MPRKSKKKDYGLKPFEVVSGDQRHLRIGLSMMESKAWKKLSKNSVVVYLYFKSKYNSNLHNENDLSFTYSEARQLMNARTFTKCIDELIEYGFIKLIQQNWALRKPNIYGLSDQWKFYGTKLHEVKPRRSRKAATEQYDPNEETYEMVAATLETDHD